MLEEIKRAPKPLQHDRSNISKGQKKVKLLDWTRVSGGNEKKLARDSQTNKW